MSRLRMDEMETQRASWASVSHPRKKCREGSTRASLRTPAYRHAGGGTCLRGTMACWLCSLSGSSGGASSQQSARGLYHATAH